MQPDVLKQRLGEILAEEEVGPPVDWDAVSALSATLIAELSDCVPAAAQSYLDNVEMRRSDCVFAHQQRAELLRYLRG